ncbi:PucR family transcriptional regulator [Pseudonocardia sp.]|uniref:PucR family transcriptional regulator n=1 Tax=Pseudonocardia sp. TaxID=60912 RepID=UPI003D12EA42
MIEGASETLREVAAALLAEPDELLATVVAEITAAVPGLAAEPRLRALLAATVHDTVLGGLAVFASGAPVRDAVAPDAGVELACRLAQQNVPISVMLRAYRLGQAAFQQEMLTRIGGRRVGAEELVGAARDLTSVTFSFVDAIAEQVVAAYQAERDEWLSRRNTARLARVTALLAGGTGDAPPGYDVAGTHRAAVLWSDDGGPDLERLVPPLAAAVGCARTPLVVAPDASTLWIWFPGAPEVPDGAALGPGAWAALGDPADGLDGFRASHRQAVRAQSVALVAEPRHRLRITTMAALGPLALLGADPAEAGPWVRAVLGGLAADDEPHARLRETLWTYLAHDGSLAATAAELHLHRNTVQYRIRRAVQARGCPLVERRLDVEVALLACRVLGSAVLVPE